MYLGVIAQNKTLYWYCSDPDYSVPSLIKRFTFQKIKGEICEVVCFIIIFLQLL